MAFSISNPTPKILKKTAALAPPRVLPDVSSQTTSSPHIVNGTNIVELGTDIAERYLTGVYYDNKRALFTEMWKSYSKKIQSLNSDNPHKTAFEQAIKLFKADTPDAINELITKPNTRAIHHFNILWDILHFAKDAPTSSSETSRPHISPPKECGLILTSHPSRAKNTEVYDTLAKIRETILRDPEADSLPTLWQTLLDSNLGIKKPTLKEEVETTLRYFKNIIDTLPEIEKKIRGSTRRLKSQIRAMVRLRS